MVKSTSIHQSGKSLINSLMDTHTKIARPVKSFALKSSMEFASRSLSIFNNLNSLEKKHKTWVSENETHESFDLNNNAPPAVTSVVFKKPFAPPPRKRKNNFIPRKRNMRKWIKYSLEDVEMTSDAKNTAIALQFLGELRKKREEDEKEEDSSDDKVVFRKPQKRSLYKSKSAASTSATINVFQESCPQSKEVCAKKMKKSDSSIKLSHLQDDTDDTL